VVRIILQRKCSPLPNMQPGFLWSDTGPTVSVVGRGLLSLGSRVPGPLLGQVLGGFSPLRAKFLPALSSPSFWAAVSVRRCGRGKLVAVVAGFPCLDSHGSEEQWCCRRNTKWEALYRESYRYKPRFCFQKHKTFPPDLYWGSRNTNSQKFVSN